MCAMPQRISEITRRDLWEVLAGVNWWGQLDEIAFLKRLYSLDLLPSTDNRRHDAEGDIIQHRVANNDWADDWVFSDDRFGLTHGPDETLLKFLSEMLHPAVRKPDEAARLALAINPLLRGRWLPGRANECRFRPPGIRLGDHRRGACGL